MFQVHVIKNMGRYCPAAERSRNFVASSRRSLVAALPPTPVMGGATPVMGGATPGNAPLNLPGYSLADKTGVQVRFYFFIIYIFFFSSTYVSSTFLFLFPDLIISK